MFIFTPMRGRVRSIGEASVPVELYSCCLLFALHVASYLIKEQLHVVIKAGKLASSVPPCSSSMDTTNSRTRKKVILNPKTVLSTS